MTLSLLIELVTRVRELGGRVDRVRLHPDDAVAIGRDAGVKAYPWGVNTPAGPVTLEPDARCARGYAYVGAWSSISYSHPVTDGTFTID